MEPAASSPSVPEIMRRFSGLTGLAPQRPDPQRYLWTDAFAVCNFLGLYQETGEDEWKELALKLVDQAHNVLGRYRQDDPRRGWISGLDDEAARTHPTRGGLRIGKKLRERGRGEPLDERAEWDRDGQYYHYLTKWIHALSRTARVTGEFIYLRWAIELAKRAHSAFVYTTPGRQKRMYWKMSTDLSYPVVRSMGYHDPLDGLITYTELQIAGSQTGGVAMPDLDSEIADMAELCRGRKWMTDDPLGIGGLLADAFRVGQLMVRGAFTDAELLTALLNASLEGLKVYLADDPFTLPAVYRLAFRELGLSIGIRAAKRLKHLIDAHPRLFLDVEGLNASMELTATYRRIAGTIEEFWLQPENQGADTWIEHRNINLVMLATSLAPDGYLQV